MHSDMRSLNNQFHIFTTGSDQIWNNELNWWNSDFYYLDFAEIQKKKIAVSASFGTDSFRYPPSLQKRLEYFFSRFDAISVRETEAVDVLRDRFNTESQLILDPVFLIPTQKYEAIAATSRINKTEKFIAVYFIVNDYKSRSIIDSVCKKLALPIIDASSNTVPVEDWLWAIKNADLVLTNSFHASCFSIIFNKKFLTLYSTHFPNDPRLKILSKITGIKNNFVHPDEFDIQMLSALDYDSKTVGAKLSELKEVSIKWIKAALEKESRQYPKSQEVLEAIHAETDNRLNNIEGKCIYLEKEIGRLEGLLTKQKKQVAGSMSPSLFRPLKRIFGKAIRFLKR